MDNLEPITRNEMFLNGDDLEPITREEMILAGADLEPITRHEWFLKKYRGGGGGGEYDLVNIPNLPADIASFSNGTDLPMASLKVAVTPYQDLSHGDPSPENICPIIGWDEAVVSVTGINVWDEEWESGSISDASGQDATNSNYRRSKNYISVKANKKYYFNVPSKYGTTYRFYQYKQNKDYIGIKTVDSDGTFETDNDCAFIRFRIATTEDYTNDISINYPSTDTEYHAYNGHTYTIDLDGTRYGGMVDATNGTMDDTLDHIASYNGEALPSTWISDRDVYAEGTTPTIGAEVVYTRATPITVQLAPQPVKSLEGVNNINANCGQITEVKYFKKA